MFVGGLVSVLKAVSRKVMNIIFFACVVRPSRVPPPKKKKRKQFVIIKKFGNLKGPSSGHLRAYSFSLEAGVQVN